MPLARAELSVLTRRSEMPRPSATKRKHSPKRLEKPPLGYQKRVTVANTTATRPRRPQKAGILMGYVD